VVLRRRHDAVTAILDEFGVPRVAAPPATATPTRAPAGGPS
jgi:hypothetical protein